MSVIVSRYVSKCTVCGVRIPVGSKVNWARKVVGVSHAGGCEPVTFKARSQAARETARTTFEEDTKVLNKAGKWVGIIEQVESCERNGIDCPGCSTCDKDGAIRTAAARKAAGVLPVVIPSQWGKPVAPKCTRNPCKGCNVCNEDGDGSESETPDLPF